MPFVIKDPKHKVVECPSCLALIGYREYEVYSDRAVPFLYIECPCCTRKIEIEENDEV